MSVINKKELRIYREFLNKLVAQKSDEYISNGGEEHAEELFAVLFNNAEDNVRIFSESFTSDLVNSEGYKKALQGFLKRGKSLKILLEHEPSSTFKEEPDSTLYYLLNNSSSSVDKKVEIHFFEESDKARLDMLKALKSNHCNFSIFDDRMFRFEYAPKDYKASASFNQPKVVRALTKIFDDYFSGRKEVKREEVK